MKNGNNMMSDNLDIGPQLIECFDVIKEKIRDTLKSNQPISGLVAFEILDLLNQARDSIGQIGATEDSPFSCLSLRSTSHTSMIDVDIEQHYFNRPLDGIFNQEDYVKHVYETRKEEFKERLFQSELSTLYSVGFLQKQAMQKQAKETSSDDFKHGLDYYDLYEEQALEFQSSQELTDISERFENIDFSFKEEEKKAILDQCRLYCNAKAFSFQQFCKHIFDFNNKIEKTDKNSKQDDLARSLSHIFGFFPPEQSYGYAEEKILKFAISALNSFGDFNTVLKNITETYQDKMPRSTTSACISAKEDFTCIELAAARCWVHHFKQFYYDAENTKLNKSRINFKCISERAYDFVSTLESKFCIEFIGSKDKLELVTAITESVGNFTMWSFDERPPKHTGTAYVIYKCKENSALSYIFEKKNAFSSTNRVKISFDQTECILSEIIKNTKKEDHSSIRFSTLMSNIISSIDNEAKVSISTTQVYAVLRLLGPKFSGLIGYDYSKREYVIPKFENNDIGELSKLITNFISFWFERWS